MKNLHNVKELRKHAEQGAAEAQCMLGVAYAFGHDVPQDHTEAALWYGKSAEQGYSGAQNNLGVMYLEGQGVPQDYAKAMEWFRKSADQGDSGGLYNLAGMYARGDGAPQDYAKAMPLYRHLAAEGDRHAQYKLGLMHANGNGTPKNYVEAYLWLNLAIAHEHESAVEKRDEIEKLMTPEQVEAARIRLSGCMEIHLKVGERIKEFCLFDY